MKVSIAPVKQTLILSSILSAIALSASGIVAPSAIAQEEAVPVMVKFEKPVVLSPGVGLSITGAMGLPLNPTAQIPNPGDIHIQGDYVDLGNLDNDSISLLGVTPQDDEIGDFKFYGLHAATRIGKSRFELSGGVEKLRARGGKTVSGDLFGLPFLAVDSNVDYDKMDRTRPAVGIKYLMTRNPRADAGHFAIGVGYNPALFDNLSAYAVGSKAFNVGGRNIVGHLGARYDRFRFQSRLVSTLNGTFNFGTPINSDEESRKLSVFAGAEVPIDKRGRFSFVGEIGTENSEFHADDRLNIIADLGLPQSKFPYSAALRFNGGSIAATVGVMRQGVIDNSGLFAQLGITF